MVFKRLASMFRRLQLIPSASPTTQRDSSAPEGLGMGVTLRGLRNRGYLARTVYDVGASDGQWTELALSTWPDAQYVCFEPLVERRTALERLASTHPGQIQVLPVGLGDEDAELELGVTDVLWDSSFAYRGSSARLVPVRRLDSLLEEGRISPPDLVKVDVQGFERRVVAGGPKAFSSAQLVLLECNLFAFCPEMTTLDETFAFMSARGFIPYEFVDFLRRPLDGAMGQCDILFVRRGHWLVGDNRWSA